MVDLSFYEIDDEILPDVLHLLAKYGKKIQTLKLANNKIAHLPDIIDALPHLTTLQLQGNPLVSLSQNITKLQKLTMLLLPPTLGLSYYNIQGSTEDLLRFILKTQKLPQYEKPILLRDREVVLFLQQATTNKNIFLEKHRQKRQNMGLVLAVTSIHNEHFSILDTYIAQCPSPIKPTRDEMTKALCTK